ncbi:hypothetical protein AU468_01370 [Alkalispirochaeta sphaeroplastigenens]|uniref:POTRA domain-containing protein n=1 Tax=Alkalispirochaeta sphaeroplastigenens TaxID=1187066 RepID=A0A2S4K0R8_9SPIO|nr:hypothetical protein [Alkalispirochaeta sphaeroplastigenens]POR05357.1 hypothetical protein AU468_01370 [Alkalispirochaeta sphaeroplastigenens]
MTKHFFSRFLLAFPGIIFLSGVIPGLPAEERAIPAVEAPHTAERTLQGPLVIHEVSWTLQGRTRRWVLEQLLEIKEGLEFPSEEALEEFIREQQQLLTNQRELQSSSISYEILPPDSPDTHDPLAPRLLHVTVETQDTWNVIALPYVRYDSNDGLLLSFRIRDYNFFGTLQDLRIDLDYEFTDDDENIVTLSSEFKLPFQVFQRDWALVMEQSLSLEEDEFDLELGIGLEYYFSWLRRDWTLGFMQEYRYLTDDDEDDNDYFTNSLTLGTGIDLPLRLPGFGQLRYLPSVKGEVKYRPGGISEERKGTTAGFEHGLRAGRANWDGNYRQGLTLALENENTYNITTDSWDQEITTRVSGYRAFLRGGRDGWPRLGISGSLSSFYLINGADDDQDDAAKDARGIMNDKMNGDLGIFLNLDVLFTVWTLRPIFEMQIGPFFDIAYVRDTRGDFHESSSFDRHRDIQYSAGFSVIGFPLFARSLFLRGTYGLDLEEIYDGTSPLDGNARVIFIGLGHHY